MFGCVSISRYRGVSAVLLTLLLGLLLQPALGQDIQGGWTVDYAATLQNMTPAEKEKMDRLPPHVQQGIAASFTGKQFIFLAHNSLQIRFHLHGQETMVKGTYAYDANRRRLHITADGIERFFQVQWMQEDIIRLMYDDVNQQGLFQSLTLISNQ